MSKYKYLHVCNPSKDSDAPKVQFIETDDVEKSVTDHIAMGDFNLGDLIYDVKETPRYRIELTPVKLKSL